MTAPTFNQFALLPGEIRDQIWDMAVRPHGTRGVHYFSLFECHPHHPLPDRFNRTIKKTIYCHPNIIGAPLPQDDASPHSWTEGNRSTYAIDGGLWTTCRESRAAMHRRYEINSWAKLYDAQRKSWRCKGSVSCRWIDPDEESKYGQMPAIFGVDNRNDDRDDDSGDGDGRQYFTVLPLYDLIYLQPWACGLDFWSFIREITFASPRFGFGGVRHIAFEYDPSWTAEEVWQFHREWTDRYKEKDEQQNEPSTARWNLCEGFTDFIRDGRLSYDSQIWLVDRRLRRKSTVLDERDTEMVFGKYGGWKRQLLTFNGEDGSRYYTMPEDYERNFCCYNDGSEGLWAFISALEEVAALLEAEEQGIDVYIDGAPTVRRLGIMVCETDDDEGR
ncbi:hypothetical protein CSOJ01_11434 [Colletotrichum sojae]|uniref:2EXR domain-containing protein n=1 Tax=Colletotrichum sojae TaxID=2175907 RepID=A0A8H6IXW1_9PEZI|nr:hypothetical protein CSOJ01_11434 [Colletotrichum sojae]